MDLLEAFVRRHARRTTRDGVSVLITDGDALLVAAFVVLGWDDPHADVSADEAATVTAPERAVLPRPRGRTGV